jgi:hypothetical protein
MYVFVCRKGKMSVERDVLEVLRNYNYIVKWIICNF